MVHQNIIFNANKADNMFPLLAGISVKFIDSNTPINIGPNYNVLVFYKVDMKILKDSAEFKEVLINGQHRGVSVYVVLDNDCDPTPFMRANAIYIS